MVTFTYILILGLLGLLTILYMEPNTSKVSPMLMGVAIGFIIGGVAGYFGATMLAPIPVPEQVAQEGSNPLGNVSENPLEEVKTNPFEDVKYNPFE